MEYPRITYVQVHKMAVRRRHFPSSEKLFAVYIAEQTNNCEAAWRLSVSEKLIKDWRKARDRTAGKWKGAHQPAFCGNPNNYVLPI